MCTNDISGCGISKMVGHKKQDLLPRINKLKSEKILRGMSVSQKLVIILENQLIKEDLQKFAFTSFFCSVLFSIAIFLQKNLAVILKIAINETKNIRKKYIRLFCRCSLVWCKVVHGIVPRDSYPRSLQLVYIWAYPRVNEI